MRTLFPPFFWEIFSIPRNILYLGIKFNKFVTIIHIYISIILFTGINKYNLKQTHLIINYLPKINHYFIIIIKIINKSGLFQVY